MTNDGKSLRKEPFSLPKAKPDSGQFDPLFGALLSDGWFPSPAHVFRRAMILDIFQTEAPGKLLEMGCGAGRLLVDWSKLGHRGVAVEPDPDSRALAASCVRSFNIPFDVRDNPPDGAFDYLVATEVLEHIENPEDALRSWISLLKPGGFALFTVPAFAKYWGPSDEWAGHVARFEPDEFMAMLQAVGLEILKSRLYGFPVGNMLRIAGNVAASRALRKRGGTPDRLRATLASGRDRRTERRIAPILSSMPGRAVLHLGIGLQRRFNRGHGLVVTAHKAAIDK